MAPVFSVMQTSISKMLFYSRFEVSLSVKLLCQASVSQPVLWSSARYASCPCPSSGWKVLGAYHCTCVADSDLGVLPPFSSPGKKEQRGKKRDAQIKSGVGKGMMLDYFLLVRGIELCGASLIFAIRIPNFLFL